MADRNTGALSWASLFKPIRDTFVFRGRSRRTEVAGLIGLGMLAQFCWAMIALALASVGVSPWPLPNFIVIWNLAWTIPWIALLVRRMHDQDRSAWWILLLAVLLLSELALVMLPADPESGYHVNFFGLDNQPRWSWLSASLTVGSLAALLALFGLVLAPGTIGPNRYGPDPREDLPATA